jgi:hypothetical protein
MGLCKEFFIIEMSSYIEMFWRSDQHIQVFNSSEVNIFNAILYGF